MNIEKLANYFNTKYSLFSNATEAKPVEKKIITDKDLDDNKAKRFLEIKDYIYQAYLTYLAIGKYTPSGVLANTSIRLVSEMGEPVTTNIIHIMTDLALNVDDMSPEVYFNKLKKLASLFSRESLDKVISYLEGKSDGGIWSPKERFRYIQNIKSVYDLCGSLVVKQLKALGRLLLKTGEELDFESIDRDPGHLLSPDFLEFLRSKTAQNYGLTPEILQELLNGDPAEGMRQKVEALIRSSARSNRPKIPAGFAEAVARIKASIAMKKKNLSTNFSKYPFEKQDDDIEKMLARRKKKEIDQVDEDRAFNLQQQIANEWEKKHQIAQEELKAKKMQEELDQKIKEEDALVSKYSNVSFEQWCKRGSK